MPAPRVLASTWSAKPALREPYWPEPPVVGVDAEEEFVNIDAQAGALNVCEGRR